MTSSLGVIVLYWSWYTYYSYDSDSLVYDDQTGVCLVLTGTFLLALVPVCLHYRNIELTQDTGAGEGDKTRRHLRHHRRHADQHRDRSPPPKYQETVISQQ